VPVALRCGVAYLLCLCVSRKLLTKWFEAIVITPRRSTTKSARFIEIVPRYRNRVTKGAILILKARFTPFGDASNVPEPATPKPGPCPQAASSAPGSEQQAFGTPRRGLRIPPPYA